MVMRTSNLKSIPAAARPGLNLELHTTTTMPVFILEENRITAAAGEPLTYRYDANRLAKTFPNLDLPDHDRRTGLDTISNHDQTETQKCAALMKPTMQPYRPRR